VADVHARRCETLTATAKFLWGLLDDISTLDDMVRDDDAAFRRGARVRVERRNETGIESDGYELDLSNLAPPVAHAEDPKGEGYLVLGNPPVGKAHQRLSRRIGSLVDRVDLLESRDLHARVATLESVAFALVTRHHHQDSDLRDELTASIVESLGQAPPKDKPGDEDRSPTSREVRAARWIASAKTLIRNAVTEGALKGNRQLAAELINDPWPLPEPDWDEEIARGAAPAAWAVPSPEPPKTATKPSKQERAARVAAGKCPDCGSGEGHFSGCESGGRP